MLPGCIHGRFQPFHNGHLEYLKGAKKLSSFVTIGITQYEPFLDDENSPGHRLNKDDNPFSYIERVRIIRAAIKSNFDDPENFDIVPFPIHNPKLIVNYVDNDVLMYTTVYEEWNLQKARRLIEAGFKVRILWRRRRHHKAFEGRVVRNAMSQDRRALFELLPTGAFEKVEEILRHR